MLSVMVAPADRGFLLYTAEIPPEHEEAFAASAAARYAGYEETVARILARGGLDLARGVDQRGSSNSSEDSSD
jgi:predicted TPR repeat methyltransferase